MALKNIQIARHVAILRIAFGCMWAIDAAFKWQPAFRNGFLDQVQSAAQGQPSWLSWWFNFWVQLLAHGPHFFAIVVAVSETLIALALIFGFARGITYLAAAVFSLLIWGVGEGFGGPYGQGSTDIGTGIVYVVVFLALYGLERVVTPSQWSLDGLISKRVSWWSTLTNPKPAK